MGQSFVKNVGLKGTNKLADKWDKNTYIVIDMPDKTIPVYKVQRESGESSAKTLHRNMFLPFSVIPGKSEVSIPSKNPEPKRSHNTRQIVPQDPVCGSETESDSDSSQSETYQKYVIPARRNRHISYSKHSVPDQTDRSHVSVPTDTSHRFDSLPSTHLDITGTRSSNRSQNSITSQSSSSVPVDSSASSTDFTNLHLATPPPEPRRSGRVKHPPDRYGDWLTNQQTIDPEETQIWYV